jgi:hypothetical protein
MPAFGAKDRENVNESAIIIETQEGTGKATPLTIT